MVNGGGWRVTRALRHGTSCLVSNGLCFDHFRPNLFFEAPEFSVEGEWPRSVGCVAQDPLPRDCKSALPCLFHVFLPECLHGSPQNFPNRASPQPDLFRTHREGGTNSPASPGIPRRPKPRSIRLPPNRLGNQCPRSRKSADTGTCTAPASSRGPRPSGCATPA